MTNTYPFADEVSDTSEPGNGARFRLNHRIRDEDAQLS